MAWSSAGRSLPSNWEKIRADVFRRDGFRCVWKNVYGERCQSDAEECDHIGSNRDHSMTNLRSLCHHHHALHTAAQAAAAKRAKRARISKKFRRVEEHPGRL